MRLIICLFLLAGLGFAETPAKEKKKSPEELLEIAVGGMPMALQAVGLMDLAGLPQWSPTQATALRVRAFEAMVQSNVTEENPAPEMFVTALLQRVAESDVTTAEALVLRLPASAGMVAVRDLVVAKLVAGKRMEEEVGCWSGGGCAGLAGSREWDKLCPCD